MKQLWQSRITLKAWNKPDWYPCNRLQWLIKLFSLLIHSDSCGLQLYVGLYQIIACVTMYLCLQLTKFSFQITLSNTPMLIFCISNLWSKEARNECCVVEERLYYRISNLGASAFSWRNINSDHTTLFCEFKLCLNWEIGDCKCHCGVVMLRKQQKHLLHSHNWQTAARVHGSIR